MAVCPGQLHYIRASSGEGAGLSSWGDLRLSDLPSNSPLVDFCVFGLHGPGVDLKVAQESFLYQFDSQGAAWYQFAVFTRACQRCF
jgi:hypothetical protein